MITAEEIEIVGTTQLSTIVLELDEDDEQSTDNLDIIATIYAEITYLVESGNITVTEEVRNSMRHCGNIVMTCTFNFLLLLIACTKHHECCEWYFTLARGYCQHTIIQVTSLYHMGDYIIYIQFLQYCTVL